jgi:NADH-quinone oxidoreductase subunit H
MMELLFKITIFPGLLFVLLWALFVFWFSRKVLAYLHKRVGPHYNGYAGSMQTVYDFAKLLGKESIIPAHVNPHLFALIPLLALTLTILPVMLIPWSSDLLVLNTQYGVLALVVLIGIEPFLLFLTGFGSNNKYSFLGGIRILTQMISMETSFFMAALSPALLFGTMNLLEITQSATWLTTLILLPGALLFFISALGILAQPPFNIPDAEQEIVYGFYTEYTGTNYLLLKSAELTEFLIIFAATITLFFAGFRGGFVDGFGILFLKMLVLAVIMITVRASTPRIRLDQMLSFAWTYLVPLSFLNLAWVLVAKLYLFGGI